MERDDLAARHQGRWYKMDEDKKPYISADDQQWFSLESPTSNADIVATMRGGHRAYEAWHIASSHLSKPLQHHLLQSLQRGKLGRRWSTHRL
jgi:hypothetical protein